MLFHLAKSECLFFVVVSLNRLAEWQRCCGSGRGISSQVWFIYSLLYSLSVVGFWWF